MLVAGNEQVIELAGSLDILAETPQSLLCRGGNAGLHAKRAQQRGAAFHGNA